MCGIAGLVNFQEPRELIRNTQSLQGHRGPDHQGQRIHDQVVLVHQRLSIIDPSERSNQPFVKDGLVIVFNGEIYNYESIREQLRKERRVEFITTGDTEVVLEAYRHWGTRCFDRFIGMFALAIVDERRASLLVARDHFGIKPLYYLQSGIRFAFASELKTLLAIPGLSRSLNRFSLLGSLNYLWTPGDESIIEGIHKVPPAHFLEADLESGAIRRIERYWELDTEPFAQTEDQLVGALREVLEASVKRHMVADVPVSSFLSGGLDSSYISALAAQHTPRLSTYTIGTRKQDQRIEKMPDDEKYAALIARRFGFDHHAIVIRPDIVHDLETMVRRFDEPIGDPAAINTYLICKQAREHGVKVLLSGMGADELFFGYRRQAATLLASRYRAIPGAIRTPIERVLEAVPVRIHRRGFRTGRWVRRFIGLAGLPVERGYRRSYSYYDDDQYARLLQGDFSGEVRKLNEQHRAYFYERSNTDLQNRMCFTDLHLFMAGLNLSYSDRASMAASVEVRVPFIDREVVQFAMKVPGRLKYKNGESKYLLKKAAESVLPRRVIYRPKAAFGAPIRSWISGELRPMVMDLLSERRINRRGIFKYEAVKKLIDDDRAGVADNAYQIYHLMTLELWFTQHLGT
jgi:asparagine synthase (glutamine-hydrolysing)